MQQGAGVRASGYPQYYPVARIKQFVLRNGVHCDIKQKDDLRIAGQYFSENILENINVILLPG